MLQQLASSSDETKRQELLVNYVKEQVVKVLGLDESSHLDLQKPLNEMGLNSLMNIDLKNRIDTEIAVNLPIEILLAESNIYQLVNILMEQLTSKSFESSFYWGKTVSESDSCRRHQERRWFVFPLPVRKSYMGLRQKLNAIQE